MCLWSIVLTKSKMTANEPKMKTQMAIQSPEDVLEMHHKPCYIASEIVSNLHRTYLKVITHPYTCTVNWYSIAIGT